MDTSNNRRYNLQTTCLKNGGFRHYVNLPPQSVFQHVYWVLGSEIEVRIRRKQTFFNRETSWMRLPVYMTIDKGMLIIYVTNDAGYILRIPAAMKIDFNGAKKPAKTRGNDPTYVAHIVLEYSFGEVHLRFKNHEDLRPWRTLILAAHHSQQGLALVAQTVARNLFRSTSLESVISAKSVAPSKDKYAVEEMTFHRHRRDLSNEEDPQRLTPTTIEEESAVQKSISDVSVASNASALRTIVHKECQPAFEALPVQSPHDFESEDLDEVSDSKIESDYEASLTQQGGEHLLDISAWEPSATSTRYPSIVSQRSMVKSDSDLTSTSEVDVSFKDLNPNNGSTTSVYTAILNHNDVIVDGIKYTDDALDDLPIEVPAEPVITKFVAEKVKLEPTPPVSKISKVSLFAKAFERPQINKKVSSELSAAALRRSKAMEFWKQQESKNNINAQVPPVKLPRVNGHERGLIFSSSTKFNNTVDVFKADQQQHRGGNESHI